jgi:hypothetical protein
MYGHANATNLTGAEVAVFLSENLPAGYQWTRYNGNSLGMPTWACGRLYAMLYVNSWHSRSTGAQGYKQCLHIATDEALASRGYWNGYRVPASRSRGYVNNKNKTSRRRVTATRRGAASSSIVIDSKSGIVDPSL